MPTTPLFGREREVAEIKTLLHEGPRRLVSLVGPGGVGKTRLALRVAAGLTDQYADGVAFVSLASIADPALVLPVIARTLRIAPIRQAPPGHDWLNSLIEALHDRQTLVVLDNVEHLAAAAPDVAALLAGCPALSKLATSRMPLRLSEEQTYTVAPLSLPTALLPEEATASPAVALFVERARAVQPSFELTAANAATLIGICHRLDGLPLAIELAAARIAHLSPAALLDRLDSRLPLLTGGFGDAPARHRTMRNAIAWSVDLLDAPERSLFARLAVFANGCTLDAAEWVMGHGDWGMGDKQPSPITYSPSPNVLDGISSLLDKSLLRRIDRDDGEPRYVMLETIREYGLELLAASGEEAAVRDAHAAYLLSVAEEAEPHLSGPNQVAWLNRLETELPNVRAALGWLREAGRTDDGLRLTGALGQFWWRRGYLREGRAWLAAFLAAPAEAATARARIRALVAAGELASWQKDLEQASAWFAEAAALARELGDGWGEGMALRGLGTVEIERGAPDKAGPLLDESFARFRALNDTWGAGRAMSMQGVAALSLGDHARAAGCFGEALALFRDRQDWWYVIVALEDHGLVALARGDDKGARRAYSESLALANEIGDRTEIAWSLMGLAGIAEADGDVERSVLLLGASAALRRALGARLQPIEQTLHDRIETAARAAMDDATFAAAWERGTALSLAEATALGGESTAQATKPVGATTPQIGGIPVRLTLRERAVLRLLVKGHSDREIAGHLSISTRTASSHVGRILGKLDARTRTAAATIALRERLV